MNLSESYVIITIAILAIVAILVFFVNKGKKSKRFTPLAGLALVFVIAGIIFGSDMMLGYILLGIGIIIAVIDIVIKLRNKKKR
ncbi:MAG: hypothetical protein V1870_03785 [Candidatus Aenigmatarchaeota archaeon]